MAGAALAGGGVLRSLSTLEDRDLPRVAVMASVFFTASLWHVPLPMPGTSIHLVLCGLLGVVLRRHAFLAVAIVLALQAVMFGHGGITSLGVNIVAMALPGPLLVRTLSPVWRTGGATRGFIGGALLGGGAIVLASAIVALGYWFSDSEYDSFLPAYFIAQVPLVLIEALLTGSTILLLRRARPTLIGATRMEMGERYLDAA